MIGRADLYHFFAEALTEPPKWLAAPGKRWPLHTYAIQFADRSAAAREAVLELQAIPSESNARRAARFRNLVRGGDGRPGIRFYESLYRSGRLAGPEMFSVDLLYRAEGLSVQTDELQDHASLELAFLAYLAGLPDSGDGSRPRRQSKERKFLKHHGDWLVELGRDLAATGDPVYAPVGRFLAGWLTELSRPPQPPRQSRKLPALRASPQCILCGFCAQVCPTEALTIRETDRETGLVLSAGTCIECAQCILVCEPGCLTMRAETPGDDPAETRRLLVVTSRAVCPDCGAPTISRAELSYMQSILGRPGWLEQCLDCRSPAKEGTR